MFKIKSLILALLSAVSLPYVLQLNDIRCVSMSIVSLIIFISFYCLISKAFDYTENKDIKKIYSLGWFFSFLLTFGRNNALFGIFPYSFANIFKIIIVATGFSFVITAFLVVLIHNIEEKKCFNVLNNSKFADFFREKVFLKSFLIISFFWFFYWLTVAPGVFAYDIHIQLNELYSGELSNWHSVIHTLFSYYALRLGQKYFHSDNLGLIFAILPQVLLLISVFSYAVKVFVRNNAPVLITVLSILFFSLNPLIPIMAFSTDKDVCFGALLFLIVIFTAEGVLEKEQFFKSKTKIFLLFLSSVLAVLLRSNGVLLITAVSAVYLISFKGYRKEILAGLCIPAIFGFLWLTKISPMLDIKFIPPEEPISIPLHQMASVVYNQEISDEDREFFYELVPQKAFDYYQIRSMDYAKIDLYFTLDDKEIRYFNRENFANNKDEYVKLWKKWGRQYPLTYAAAFLNLNLPYWYPDYIYYNVKHGFNDYLFMENYDFDYLKFKIQRYFPDGIDFWNRFFNDFENKPIYQKNFITGLFFSTGLPVWLLIFTAFYMAYKRKYFYLLILTVPFFTSICYLFGPTYLVRYSLPIIYCIPVYIFCIFLQTLKIEKK